MVRNRVCYAALLMFVCGALSARPVVALLTDFGVNTEAVGLCHGAIASINSEIEVVDLCHTVEAYDIGLAALMLHGTTVFPKGSVIVCVVDPGVGTSRQPCALRTKRGLTYVGPNNGVFSYVAREQGVEQFVTLVPERVNPKWQPGTFDGRDLFSPAGALLATDGDLKRVGDLADPSQLVLLPESELSVDGSRGSITGVYLRTDEPYGNLWTNITSDALTSASIRVGDLLKFECDTVRLEVPFVISFGHVKSGQALAYLNSSDTLAFAINMGDFRKEYGLKSGTKLTVRKMNVPAPSQKP
ncbi:MAG: SAM hydrolase/SAM-dependent halogenase family protein [Candidatus Sumerlaeaceae bacterium]